MTGATHAPDEHSRTGMGRRQFLAASAAAGLRGRLAGPLVGSMAGAWRAPLCACVAGAAGLSAPAVLAAQAALPFAEVADGVFARYGLQEPITADNRGAIANIGFVVGEASVCVIDTGTTRQQGAALRMAIARVTDRPISHIVATHVHLDHVFGHAAFDDLAVARIGHHRLPHALAERGPYYLEQLHALVPEMADTAVVLPDTLVEASTTIELGNRPLVLTAWPAAHTDNDLTAFDARTGILWASDLLFVDRLPTIDGSLLGWLAAMETLAPPEVTAIMPGHGPIVSGSEADAALAAQRAYLTRLRDRVRQAIADGMGISDTIAALGADDPGAWLLHDENHGRNITTAYAELEWE